ncbi:MAG TPA: hypothetical protein ENI92_03790 [Bacteroidetes bacterium]|nr:hypothetical protein [Bacteroidota bacterium]
MKRTSLYSTAGILLITLIVVLVNLIANTRFFRLDLTEGKTFTLSPASKQVVGNLQDPLTVKVFASRNLSPQLGDVKRFLNDLLSDYRAYGHGRFRYEFIDPSTSDDLEKEAQSYRIPPFQENVWNKDQLELKKVYLGAVFLYQDKQETLPAVQSTAGLEYNITSLIKRLTSQQDRTIGFLTGHGEATTGENLRQVSQVLQSNYKVREVDLTGLDGVPDDIDVLLIIDPQSEIPDADKLKVDQFIMKGRPVGWFFNKVDADLQRGMARSRLLKIDEWTKTYGFRVNEDLVADLSSEMIQIQQRAGFFTIANTIKYPFFPRLNRFNKDHSITANFEVASLFFPSSIDTTLAADKEIKLTPLMFSGDRSMVEEGRYNINATRKFSEAEFDRAYLPLAAALEGPFDSYFAARDLPTDEDGKTILPEDELVKKAPENTRMVVVGDGLFLRDDYLSNPSNVLFLLNSVDWLVNDTDLIALRTREVKMRPLKDIAAAQKQVWKTVNWFLPPLLVILLGLVYWQVRRNSRTREI